MKAVLLILLLPVALACGQGTILWQESTHGPLSEHPSTPTFVGNLQPGSNAVIGVTSLEPTAFGYVGYNDYFTFTIASGLTVESIFVTVDSLQIAAYLGTPTFGLPIHGATGNALNGSLLPQMGATSLPAGHYGMFLENNNVQPFTTVANYRLDFVVTPVPEPAAWALLALGGAGLWALRRRRGVRGASAARPALFRPEK